MDSLSLYGIIIGVAILVLWRRTRAMYRPIKGKGIRLLVPIVFLIPSLLLITSPEVHVVAWEWISALAFGVLLSIPLIWTTNYERRADQKIYAVKNKSFVIAFLAVLAVRFLLRDYLNALDAATQSALFITVAIGYILPWRMVSFMKFRKLLQDQSQLNGLKS